MNDVPWGARLRYIVALWERMEPQPHRKALAGALSLNPGQVTKILQRVEDGDSLEDYSPNAETREAIASMLEGAGTFADLSHTVGRMRATVEELEAALEVRRQVARAARESRAGLGAPIPDHLRHARELEEALEGPHPEEKEAAGGG